MGSYKIGYVIPHLILGFGRMRLLYVYTNKQTKSAFGHYSLENTYVAMVF